MEESQLAKRLSGLLTVNDVVGLIKDLEGEAFRWLPVGGRPNNEGPIRQGSLPADSLTERITNSIDAVLEREWMEHHLSEAQPSSPREAAEKWFKIKHGRLSTIASDTERRNLASRIRVTLYESGVVKAPTIVVSDTGIGQPPSRFEDTLLSLSEDNKINKHFLMGAYGQGGSTAYAWCKYTVILSRRPPSLLRNGEADTVGWTIVRYNPLDVNHKNGTFEYIVGPDKKISGLSPEAFRKGLPPGTTIRMIQYDLAKNFTIFTAVSSSLWSLTNLVLPDPVLPFLIGDERLEQYEKLQDRSEIERTRPVIGSINRLRRKADGKGSTSAEEDDRKVKLLHSQECKVNLGHYGEPVIRYWILGPSEGGKSVPIDAYADSQSAIIVTLNGQRQGRQDRSYFRNTLGLAILRDYMLIQIDCDQLSKAGKKELFSSNRNTLRDVELLDMLMGEAKAIILKDPDVIEIARKLQEAMLKSASSARNLRLSRQLEQLIAKWEVGDKKRALTEVGKRMLYDSKGSPTVQTIHRLEEVEVDDDEETEPRRKPTPEVYLGRFIPNEFDFDNKREPLRIPLDTRRRKNGKGALSEKPHSLWFETDGMDNCLTRDENPGRLSFQTEPAGMLIERTRSGMKGGRVFLRVVPSEAAEPNTEFTISAKLAFETSKELVAQRRAIFVTPHPGKRKPVKVEGEPRYKIVPVLREGEHWETDSEEKDKKERISLPAWTLDTVAEVQPAAAEGIAILVNMSNTLYVSALKEKVLSPETITRYSDKYKVAIAFHAYLQHRAETDLVAAGKTAPSDEVQAQELERTVRTVIFTTFVAPEAEVLAPEMEP